MENLQEKYQQSLEMDSGVAELSALLSECDSLRDRLDLMRSSYNTIDSQMRTRRSSLDHSAFLSPSSPSSVHHYTMKTMLEQTKDEYDRLVQTLKSSKQTIESKQQRTNQMRKSFEDLQTDFQLFIERRQIFSGEELSKENQYEYQNESQRKRVRDAAQMRRSFSFVRSFS